MRMKKIISVVAGAVFAFTALYFLTAPFMLDVLWNRQWEPNVKGNADTMTASWEFYGPARAAITADWFGRDI